MKVIVAWDKEEAGLIASQVIRVGGLLKASHWVPSVITPSVDGLSQQYLEFETEDFSEGKIPAEVIQRTLKENYGIRSFIAVQVVPGRQFQCIADYAVEQELHANRRLKAMRDAIDMLKATRSWFKDKRLAEIRRRLEQNLY